MYCSCCLLLPLLFRTYLVSSSACLAKDSVPERRTLRDILDSIGEFAIVASLDCDISHRDHSHQVAILVHDRNAPYLLVSHLPNHVDNSIVGMGCVNIDGHDVFSSSARAILVLGNRTYDYIAVGD